MRFLLKAHEYLSQPSRNKVAKKNPPPISAVFGQTYLKFSQESVGHMHSIIFGVFKALSTLVPRIRRIPRFSEENDNFLKVGC